MKIITKSVFLCFSIGLLFGCSSQDILGMRWIDETNATPMQKQGLRDGCMYAFQLRYNNTIVRDIGGVVINPYYSSEAGYRNLWRESMYLCSALGGSVSGEYLRNWNVIGFKGDTISYKGD